MTEQAATDPPLGSPWDDPIEAAPLVFLDLEMTGLKPATDRVIEVCAERVRGDTLESALSTLVRPDDNVFGNAHVHGIEWKDLEGAPTFREIVDRLMPVLEGGIIVAHAAQWDVTFLEAELSRVGPPRVFPFYLDTLTLSRRSFALPAHNMAALCASLGVPQPRAHRAADDVHTLRQVFQRILGVLAPRTPRDLWHVRIGQRHARPAIVEAALAAAESGAIMRVRYRPAHRAPEELTFRVTGVRTDLDPPRVLGYLLPSRSRRELRADRILALDPHDDAARR
ncbi:3'-5' exonuclease [Polyangium aurulentum]|uniref:3'-5' exonuclease n=1 Tax=Polyangium aurulentum TaxID=2567896 RepID=UPI00146A277A|nr:3'-5' exonuclease [Polyangium aurulentum]UQA62120.1 3'-5' exonuclease [Polyangium aurulentum]